VIPQISAIMGPCAGGAVYSPAITDFNIMVEGTSYMFVTGPDVIKTVTHEEVTKEELGGAMTHNAISGVAHFAVPDDRECLRLIRELADICPATTWTTRLGARTQSRRGRMRHWIGSCRNRPISRAPTSATSVFDEGAFLEVHRHYARNPDWVRAPRRRPVSIVANQPAHLAGRMDIDASVKGALQPCVSDVIQYLAGDLEMPGFPARDRRWRHHSSRRQTALCLAERQFQSSVITRRASRRRVLRHAAVNTSAPTSTSRWPRRIAVMGPDGAVNILYKREIGFRAGQGVRAAARRGVQGKFANPYTPASRGFIDEVIRPRRTRQTVAAARRHEARQESARSTGLQRYPL
jgi:propionyl-CoA carboxylase beta chain